MRTWKRWSVVFLAGGCLLLLLSGCAAGERTAAVPAETVYDCGGVRLALPTEYLDRLIVETGGEGDALLTVWEKASVEAAEREFGGAEGVGLLFRIARTDQPGYERYLGSDHSGETVFAKDDAGGYYLYEFATDVQCYRGGGSKLDDEAWKQWETLSALGEGVRADLIRRNGLTAYSDREFYDREYTYDGDHAFVNEYPYFSFDGSKREYDTLVLSQPVGQGEGGIWCVERFYDHYGTVYPIFPETDLPAAEHYATLQKACDAGKRSELLTPLGAAEAFAREAGWHGGDIVEGTFEEVAAPNTAYWETNRAISDFVSDLMAKRQVDDMELLACMDGFTWDNWGVLGRFHYGSKWWEPLKAGLASAAVGEEQAVRDRAMLRLFLSYETTGPIAEDLIGILETQRQADSETFDQALLAFTAEEQARVRAVLED